MAAQDVLAPHAVGHLGGAVLPHLADDHRRGLLCPGGGVDTGDEIVGQLIGHVQPPAVRPRPQPPADHAVLVPEDEPAIAGVGLIHGGQGIDTPPALILVGPADELEPAAIGGVPALAGPHVGIEAVAVKIPADKARVVEHPVQHHPHAPLVGLVAQTGEVLVAAQHGVDAVIVRRAIAVVLRRLENEVRPPTSPVGSGIRLRQKRSGKI